MTLSNLDWGLIIGFFIISLGIGIYASRKAGNSATDFFLSGRNMAWWLLGISMVATTFSADTPNLVTDLVRKQGVSGNWAWWAFLLTGMLTVFVFARLWRRSMVLTDVEFYELRYSGRMATFLRGFRALYLGLIFNVLVMGAVSLAAIKFGEVLLGIPGWQTLLVAGSITLVYSALGGLKAVILTDFVQFIIAMIGSIWATIYVVNLPEVGGLTSLLNHENVIDKISMMPDFSDPNAWIPILIVPLAVQWWASYYPGAEPGGGGYIAQRMFSAKDEKNAVGATLLFNIAHYALRPWPWILIALASLIVFPMQMSNQTDDTVVVAEESAAFLEKNVDSKDIIMLSEGIDLALEGTTNKAEKDDLNRLKTIVASNQEDLQVQSLAYIFSERNKNSPNENWSNPLNDEKLVTFQLAYPNIGIDKLGQDLGYPAMLTKLPPGLLGLIIASLIGAFMSTMSTQLNLGASYLVNDFYKRFIKPEASDKHLVNAGRGFTVISAIMGMSLGLMLTDAGQAFTLLLLLGAGTGLIYILRWFWWRINAATEIIAMIASLLIATYFTFFSVNYSKMNTVIDHDLEGWQTIIIGAVLTTLIWVIATYLTPPTDDKTLINFYKRIQPGGNGWNPVIEKAKEQNIILEPTKERLPLQILCFVIGTITVYAALFATGNWIYGETTNAIILTVITGIGGYFLLRFWSKITA